jgi:hypothetical protein
MQSPDSRQLIGLEDFPAHDKVKEILGQGKKRVLIVHNIGEGIGDELIRNGILIQALLDYNPEIEIYILTARRFIPSATLRQ